MIDPRIALIEKRYHKADPIPPFRPGDTVKVHVKAILRKLGVENRTQAATWGVKNGLGEPVQLNLREVRPARALPRLSPVTGRAA